jgi:oxaloacetate decarboxylase beta subunit
MNHLVPCDACHRHVRANEPECPFCRSTRDPERYAVPPALPTERLSRAAQNELANIVTILLGLAVGGMMVADQFLRPETITIFILGIVAFAMGTAAGVIFGKLLYVLSGKKINPLIGAAGISAFPMSARVVQKLGAEADPHNHLLMHAAGANTGGQIGSVVAGGVVLMLLPFFLK